MFSWDSTGSMLGVYQAQVQASDGLLTDIGVLTILVTSGGTSAVPEPATLLLVGSGIAAAARYRRKKTAKTV